MYAVRVYVLLPFFRNSFSFLCKPLEREKRLWVRGMRGVDHVTAGVRAHTGVSTAVIHPHPGEKKPQKRLPAKYGGGGGITGPLLSSGAFKHFARSIFTRLLRDIFAFRKIHF